MQTLRQITQIIAYGVGAIIVMALAGCSGMESGTGSSSMAKASTPKPKDEELSLPGEYKSWPKFLSEVQRPDVKQVRELYINPADANTSRGQAFPSGTVMVMELYKAQLEGETPVTGADGKLVKVFVMGKGDGWGRTCRSRCETAPGSFQRTGLMAHRWPRISRSAGPAMRRLRRKILCIATTSTSIPAGGCNRRRSSPQVERTVSYAMNRMEGAFVMPVIRIRA